MVVDLERPHVVNPLANGPLDRDGDHRQDAHWIEKQRYANHARYVPVWRNQSLVNGDEALYTDASILNAIDNPEPLLVFLGLENNTPYFAVDISALDKTDFPESLRAGKFQDLRYIGIFLPQADAAILAYARAMVYWHRQNGYCGKCGQATESSHAGHQRQCINTRCGRIQFPRSDPAIIVLVEHEDACLLGRHVSWPEGVYSTLAGFAEPGESLEDAVIREVWEESRVRVRNAHYHSSQPWPFPASVMLGFHASGEYDEPVADGVELADVRWFQHADMQRLMDNSELILPPGFSISRQLIDAWNLQRGGDPFRSAMDPKTKDR